MSSECTKKRLIAGHALRLARPDRVGVKWRKEIYAECADLNFYEETPWIVSSSWGHYSREDRV